MKRRPFLRKGYKSLKIQLYVLYVWNPKRTACFNVVMQPVVYVRTLCGTVQFVENSSNKRLTCFEVKFLQEIKDNFPRFLYSLEMQSFILLLLPNLFKVQVSLVTFYDFNAFRKKSIQKSILWTFAYEPDMIRKFSVFLYYRYLEERSYKMLLFLTFSHLGWWEGFL